VTKSPLITPAPAPSATTTTAAAAAINSPRLPPSATVIQKLLERPWATQLQQIPATVIDVGSFKNVPYQSYRCGDDYEVNIYGDPDAPAAVEIGIYRDLLKDVAARENCVAFLASVLADPADATAVKALGRVKDRQTRGGLTFETTPETDPDAYGGWWVSAYDEAALDRARASERRGAATDRRRPRGRCRRDSTTDGDQFVVRGARADARSNQAASGRRRGCGGASGATAGCARSVVPSGASLGKVLRSHVERQFFRLARVRSRLLPKERHLRLGLHPAEVDSSPSAVASAPPQRSRRRAVRA
jgi:hypothetical protein